MSKTPLRQTSALTFAFNDNSGSATPSATPWRRAALMQRADDEFRRLHQLRPAHGLT